MPQFEDIDTYLQLPPLTPSQSAEPSPLAMLAATCKRIGGSSPPTSLPINTGSSVRRAPSKTVSPTPADCYPTSTAAGLSSYSRSTTTVMPALCPSVSPPAPCALTPPTAVYQSISPPSIYPSISPPTVYHPASPPLVTLSPPSSQCHQPKPMYGVTTTMSSQHVHQCRSPCSCSPPAVYTQYYSYPVMYQPYPRYGSRSLGPMHHRRASPAYTPYPTSMSRHHGSCRISDCGKVYGKTSHLKTHSRGQAGQRDFVCRWMHCGEDFTRSDEL